MLNIALLAMKGLMIQENMTMEEAIKLMEEGQKAPDRIAPMLPPKVLGKYMHACACIKHAAVYSIVTLLHYIMYQS